MPTLGLEGILAITGVVLQVIAAVDQVSSCFERIHNAPRHIRNFKNSACRLELNFKCLREEVEMHGDIELSDGDYEEIIQTLEACRTLLIKYETTLKNEGTIGSGFRRAYWSFTSGHELDGYKEQVDRIYLHIIHPIWLRLIRASQRNSGARSDSLDVSFAEQQTWKHNVGALATDFDGLTLDTAHSTVSGTQEPITEQKLREVDQRVREYTTILGVAVDRRLDDILVMDDENFEQIPMTLKLNNVSKAHRRLKLKEVQIMARDENTRVLHFRNHDQSIRVKHLVVFGSIPFTDTKLDLEVRFFSTHSITVVDTDGHHLYNVNEPLYRFEKLEHRRRFQEIARERDLRGEFETVIISANGKCLARSQVLRVWSRNPRTWRHMVTMTFLATSTREQAAHVVWNIDDFDPSPTLVGGSWGRKPTLNLTSLNPDSPNRNVSIEFPDLPEAQKFKKLFRDLYPRKSGDEAPQLELSSTISSSSASFTTDSGNTSSIYPWEKTDESETRDSGG